jgi:hypothetical protein
MKAPKRTEKIEKQNASQPTDEERDPDQAWFWTEEWQAGEREAEEDIRAGRVKGFDTMEELLADLNNDEDD